MMLNSISNTVPTTIYMLETKKESKSFVTVDIQPDPVWPVEVIKSLATIEGPVDIYCWYEGPACLPIKGATFMQKYLFEPLFEIKKDAKLFLYSLNGWNFNSKTIAGNIPPTTALGRAINAINKVAIECIYASSFFNYCTKTADDAPIYRFIKKELPKKTWLSDLSQDRTPIGMTIRDFFNQAISLLDCINERDVIKSYSMLQYVEGYYLIREAINRGLEQRQQKIEIAFMLPNDEAKYFQDYPQDIEKMLQADFGDTLNDMEINIRFRFFKYDPQLLDSDKTWNEIEIDKKSRPYLGLVKAGCVSAKKVKNYLPET